MTTPNNEIGLELFQALLYQSSDAIVFVDQSNRIRFWTRAAQTLFGISPAEIPDDSGIRQILGLDCVRQDQNVTNPSNSIASDDGSLMQRPGRAEYSNSHGKRILVNRVAITLVIDGHSWQMFVLKNLSTQDTRQVELERQARTDPLSDLLNRRGFQLALEANLDRPLTLAIIDVDFFKRINDEFGHATGDDAIKWIAQKLQESFAESVCVGRLGGDEFGIVLSSQSVDEARSRFDAFCEKVKVDRSDFPMGMTISIGVAVATKPGVPPRELLSGADTAMYRSKQEGRNRVTVVNVLG